jgi:hypothetical protein
MDDLIMIILVVGASALAIGLLVILNVIIGGWSPSRLRTEEAAAAALANGVFGFQAASPISLAADGRGAVALEQSGDRLGLAVCFGDRITVRALSAGDVRAVDRDGVRLTLYLDDYTMPSASLRFTDAETAQTWRSHAEALILNDNTAPEGTAHA